MEVPMGETKIAPKKENFAGENIQKNEADDTRTKKDNWNLSLKIVIACLGLIIAIINCISIYQQYEQAKKINLIKFVIRDTEDIRNTLQKPFEGVWNYRVDFTLFHGKNELYESKGKAIFIWNPTNLNYDVYIGYSICKKGLQSVVVCGFLKGYIRADQSGWPISEKFQINMEYLERLGLPPEYDNINSRTFEVKVDTVEKSADGIHASYIRATTEDVSKKGTVYFIK
jgi:hypothetical protein